MTRLLVMGPPGAGKGTQCVKLAEHFGVPHISTGDLFRSHIKNQTELGKKVQTYLDSGEYVPDDVTTDMLRARLDEPDASQGFVLDGYPRTVGQVGELDSILSNLDSSLDRVLVIEVAPDELIARLTKRAEAEGRSDDDEQVVRRRVEVYRQQTEPVLELYQKRGQAVSVDGVGSIEEVSDRLRAAVS